MNHALLVKINERFSLLERALTSVLPPRTGVDEVYNRIPMLGHWREADGLRVSSSVVMMGGERERKYLSPHLGSARARGKDSHNRLLASTWSVHRVHFKQHFSAGD
jgi:hypothetical protein